MNAQRNVKARRRAVVIVLAILVVVGLIAYLFTAAPGHFARATGTVADGSEPFEVGGGATVTPAEGWTVESKVESLAGPIMSWSVLFGDTGTEVRSPDRALTVDITAVPEADPVETAAGESSSKVITEMLASGAEVRHVQTEAGIVAIVTGVGSEPVLLDARTSGGADLTEYRPAVSQLLESLR